MNKKIKIILIGILILITVVLIIFLGYLGLTYINYGKLSRDTFCGQEFEFAFSKAVLTGNTSVCESEIRLNSYRYYYFDIKNGGWRWSPRYCRLNNYPDLLFRVNDEKRTLEKEGWQGVYLCVTYITEQDILRNYPDKTLGLIELYKYRSNELKNSNRAREILMDLMKINNSLAQEFLIAQAKNKNTDSYTRTILIVNLPKYAEKIIAEDILVNILSDLEDDLLLRLRAAETLVNITGSKHMSKIEEFNLQTNDTYLKDKITKLLQSIK